MIFNEMCFVCHYSTANGSCKCGLNQDSNYLYDKIKSIEEENDQLRLDLKISEAEATRLNKERVKLFNEKATALEGFRVMSEEFDNVFNLNGKLKQNAEKWEAFFNSDLLRVIGTAGLGEEHQHFGMEVWDIHPENKFYNKEYGQKVLNTYVSTIIERSR